MSRFTTDWKFMEGKAARMAGDALLAAIADILRTLPYADRLDREDGGDRGGRYRDESSVYRRELKRRERMSEADILERRVKILRAAGEPGYL